jgi:hypothetical protein
MFAWLFVLSNLEEHDFDIDWDDYLTREYKEMFMIYIQKIKIRTLNAVWSTNFILERIMSCLAATLSPVIL